MLDMQWSHAPCTVIAEQREVQQQRRAVRLRAAQDVAERDQTGIEVDGIVNTESKGTHVQDSHGSKKYKKQRARLLSEFIIQQYVILFIICLTCSKGMLASDIIRTDDRLGADYLASGSGIIDIAGGKYVSSLYHGCVYLL